LTLLVQQVDLYAPGPHRETLHRRGLRAVVMLLAIDPDVRRELF
jgi:hypothetical protein